MRTAVIVQARLGSKRFPGKVMAELCGHPVLWHVLTRAKQIKADHYCVAAPYADADALQPVIDECDFRAWYDQCDENDVLTRFYNAAESFGLSDVDVIVRITGDCPLIEPFLCDRVIALRFALCVDYASNVYPRRTWPRGYDCEAFTMRALAQANTEATDPYDREHVTSWMQSNCETAELSSLRKMTDDRYTIDYAEDIKRLAEFMQARQAA
jgi:spore coat polysaccharide biosynthesis protein SpsF (cytidylyltransferase family)